MDGPSGRRNEKANRELREAVSRAGALLAAVFVMLLLMLAASLGDGTREAIVDIVSAGALGKPEETPRPAEDQTVFIRLADVEKDVGADVIIRLLKASETSVGMTLSGDEPRILIYHTHDTEAYRPTDDDPYEASEYFRTEDDEKNVIAVGEELARILREEYGIPVIHAKEKHENPNINAAYSRSLETMRYYKELYPTLEMFIDLHRDGVSETGFEKDYVTVGGLQCARMMFVVGTGKSGKSSQYAPEESDTEHDMPDFESNYALALRLTETLLSYDPRFMRNVRVKAGKYNQQVSDKCLLIEVGHNANTLEQAKNSMIYLAKAIAALENGNE
ncbi:MAG: stage II sporulation protein P [Clostridiales bacterium]|nr:stage II sporulation protein P [Clostridiales bacterium]